MNSPYIIVPVHNRKEVTCRCLDMISPLLAQGWNIVVIDDGSNDGTSKTIQEIYPQVVLLEGDGNLYWNGAMELGMRWAYQDGASCIVWLNDDVSIEPKSIITVATKAQELNSVVSGLGCIIDETGKTVAYHQVSKRGSHCLIHSSIYTAESEMMPVDACRGNLVAFPRSVITSIGFPDGKNIPHMLGDLDYTLRATSAGYSCYIDPDALFNEEYAYRDDNGSWLLDSRSPLKLAKQSLSIRGTIYPRALLRYSFKHWKWRGLLNITFIYMRLVAIMTIKFIIPRTFIISIFGKRTNFYKHHRHRLEF